MSYQVSFSQITELVPNQLLYGSIVGRVKTEPMPVTVMEEEQDKASLCLVLYGSYT